MAVEYFGRAGDTPFSAWLFPQDRDAGLKAVDPLTQTVFEFYRDHIGPYPYEKLAQVEAAGSGGATEPATTIFYFGGFAPLSHEMAHQWFGDSVTESDWDDVWLSEGFATYFALLFAEHQDGRDAFLRGLRRTRDTALAYAQAHPSDTLVHENLDNDSNVFSNAPQIYQGGAMVLHMLRGVLGDQNFWAGIRLYSRLYRNGSASSEDFRHAMEDACRSSGQCPPRADDLSWFFRQWLHRGGILQLNGGWRYDAAAKQLQITLDQAQRQGLYQMPVEIGITSPAAAGSQTPAATAEERIVRMWIDQQHNTLTIPLETDPSQVRLDPNLWLPLMQADFTKR
jgi:aminopeptidase N